MTLAGGVGFVKVSVSLKLPLAVMSPALIVNAALPVLVSVMGLEEGLVEPTSTEPTSRVEGVRVTVTGEAKPVIK
jgi:hypothetical protein